MITKIGRKRLTPPTQTFASQEGKHEHDFFDEVFQNAERLQKAKNSGNPQSNNEKGYESPDSPKFQDCNSNASTPIVTLIKFIAPKFIIPASQDVFNIQPKSDTEMSINSIITNTETDELITNDYVEVNNRSRSKYRITPRTIRNCKVCGEGGHENPVAKVMCSGSMKETQAIQKQEEYKSLYETESNQAQKEEEINKKRETDGMQVEE
ncbi:hypothetical protein JTB14_015056 [Gonioctena quinquepunctata]|nr:hypothetical protein JTB14_015056 [Gonioctena quinquepunctata]